MHRFSLNCVYVDDYLISCTSNATMSKFKQELLTRFQGTDEGKVRTFRMWDCNPVLTPLDPIVRLTERDSPEVVDPRLYRRMRNIVGCLSFWLT
jgi:hypothetical protein